MLTDDYVQVECWPWQIVKVRRVRGQTVKSKAPEGSFYPVELENVARKHMAIWHDHWDRFPRGDAESLSGTHSQYLKEYRSGNKVPLPACEDIRDQTLAAPQKPKQLSLF